jgi:hypothetical protein
MFLEFFVAFFIGIFCCYLLDKIAIILYKLLKNSEFVPQNIRWFFIHFFINLYVSIAGFNDLYFCISNIQNCAISEWINGFNVFGMAISLHIYHILAFSLTQLDWLHHISSVIISSPVLLLCSRNPNAVMALWFMSGFPGCIDYLLLWMVKMGYISSYIEKNIYAFITTWIRAPGCIAASAISLGVLQNINDMSLLHIIGYFWNIFIVYWNGVFFMQHTLANFYKKKYINE